MWSLQGYPGELVRSPGVDITMDDMWKILDKHHNNVKVLDALNQELFQLRMVDKETVLDLGYLSFETFPGSSYFLPQPLPPDEVAELGRDCFMVGSPST